MCLLSGVCLWVLTLLPDLQRQALLNSAAHKEEVFAQRWPLIPLRQ